MLQTHIEKFLKYMGFDGAGICKSGALVYDQSRNQFPRKTQTSLVHSHHLE